MLHAEPIYIVNKMLTFFKLKFQCTLKNCIYIHTHLIHMKKTYVIKIVYIPSKIYTKEDFFQFL